MMSDVGHPIRVRVTANQSRRLDVASARNALLGWLFARSHRGQLVLRAPDTGSPRGWGAGKDAVLSTLAWLGVDVENDLLLCENFEASARHVDRGAYRAWIGRLLEQDQAYLCYCSRIGAL
jgi:glutamyl/glutaminyl-tRNA synthetase